MAEATLEAAWAAAEAALATVASGVAVDVCVPPTIVSCSQTFIIGSSAIVWILRVMREEQRRRVR